MVIWNLLVIEDPARFSTVLTMAGRTSRGIGSTKLRPNSYEKNKTTRQGKLSKKDTAKEIQKVPTRRENDLQLEAGCW